MPRHPAYEVGHRVREERSTEKIGNVVVPAHASSLSPYA
jgi:hypothetical protein